ncbi:class I SAM-dependent methyltransferase [Allopusillimonas ginsengisoli]|uniref:class I SAM-dependent methyltransferase n=1 Tax=Allopusillimonas ginsengisoli TaxID=453575 RepID=UPI001021A4F8|nr:SAM-dependent methyltransferase [Allopusillimonas ginsengisoli]TEA78901.1 SAM-dependent methyltransferase [Allopusillimonas ginsengisoli]
MTGYQTGQASIAIEGADDLIIRSLLDRQQYHDPAGAALRLGICSASWPLFGLVWPSGIQLAIQLANRPVCKRERILEIGCGLGLASLVGHRRGANITASDCHPLAEKFLDHNAELNGLSPLAYFHGQWGPKAARKAPLDGTAILSGQYDLIVGSDLLYERGMPEALADFIDDHATPSAEVWIIDPNRGNRPAFNRHMAAFGFSLVSDTRLDHQVTSGEALGEGYKGRLLVYER